MTDWNNIQEDNFIPDGLEFRQEYLDKAMVLYRHQKMKILWRKVYVISGTVAAIVTGVALYWNQAAKQPDSNLNQTIESQISQSESGTNHSELNDANKIEKSVGYSDEQHVQTNSKPEGKEENKIERNYTSDDLGNSKSSEIEFPDQKTVSKAKALDHGDSESSGSGSPGQKPDDSISTFDHGEFMSSGVDSPDHELNEQPDLHDKSISVTGKDATSSITKNVLENELNHGNDNTNYPVRKNAILPYINIQSIAGSLSRNEVSLANTKIIEVEKWFRWKPYLLAGLNPVSLYGSNKKSFKPDWYVAAGLEYGMHRGWSISADAHGYVVSGLSHPYIVDQTTFGQGFSTNRITYFTEQLYYAGVQFSTKKTLGNHHDVFAGYAFDYLVTGENIISTSVLSSYESVPGTETKATGYISGFTDINQSVNFGYQYRLGVNKAIGLRLQHGLSDITNNKFFTTGSFNRNSLINVYFRINLLR